VLSEWLGPTIEVCNARCCPIAGPDRASSTAAIPAAIETFVILIVPIDHRPAIGAAQARWPARRRGMLRLVAESTATGALQGRLATPDCTTSARRA
jgi:hypothetical protein